MKKKEKYLCEFVKAKIISTMSGADHDLEEQSIGTR